MISRDKGPTAQETFMQMAQAAGLRGRLLVTVGILILIRMGIHIPIPGINREEFASAIQGNNQILSFLDIFSGGGLSALGVFALGIFALHQCLDYYPIAHCCYPYFGKFPEK